MASFLPNPYGGPRLYAMIHLGDGAGSAATGGVTAAAFANLDTWLSGASNHDHLISLGVKWITYSWLYGETAVGAEYTVGATPADYPGGGGTVLKCNPHNEITHAAIAGAGYINQIVPALDTAGRKGSVYGFLIYSGSVEASSGTGAAALDAHSATARSLAATLVFDVQSAMDYSDASNPHKLAVDRLHTTYGIKTYGESWETRGSPTLAGWVAIEDGIYATSHPLLPDRADLAFTAPADWYTKDSIPSVARAVVQIAADGPSAADRVTLAQTWLARGYDVAVDMSGFSDAQITALVNYWLALATTSGTSTTRVRTGPQTIPSKLIAMVNCLDPLLGTGQENYAHGAVLPLLWSAGWQAFFDYKDIARQWTTLGVSRFLLYCPWGYYASASAKTIGYDPAQAAVTSRAMGPRQSAADLDDARLVNGLHNPVMPSFLDFWTGVVADFTSQGGEVLCFQSVPPSTTARDAMTIDNWVREAENAGMSLVLEGCAKVDRLSYATPASLLADRLAVRRRKTMVTLHEALDPRINGWANGRFGMLSGKSRADTLWGTPASYNVPNLGMESAVLLPASVVADTGTRMQAAMQWIGRSTRGSSWSAAVEISDMTDSQIVSLVQAGG